MTIRTYARIVGVLLAAFGLVGFTGALGVSETASFFHLAVGAIFAYLGFRQRDAAVVRQVVGGIGVLLIAVKVATILSPVLLGQPPLHGPIEITCLVVGLASILASRLLRDDAPEL